MALMTSQGFLAKSPGANGLGLETNKCTLTCSYHCWISQLMWLTWSIQDARYSNYCKCFVHLVSEESEKKCCYSVVLIQSYILSSKWVKEGSHNNNILCTNFAISASVTLLNSIRAWNWPESQHKPFVSSFTTSLNCRVCNRKSSGVTIGCQCSFTSTETKFCAQNFSRALTIFGEGDDSEDCPKTGENL